MLVHVARRCVACATACLAVLAAPAGAVESAPAVTDAARPRLGLVLAGGGAKGGAHVGVLKVLEELHVPVDCIAGTSMGALIGAGYASGIPARDLETFLKGIDWKAVVGGVGGRELQPIEQKRAGVTYSNNFELGLKQKRLVVPGGVVNTASIEDLLRTYVASARMQPDFDRLPIPFRAVATDMVTGDMVVLKEGDLATAMRASMAIPGAFAPVVTDKYILSDGGMVRNIPVDVARDLCAENVIVVNLVEPTVSREKLQTATQLLSRSNGVMIEANEKLQLATLTDRDVLVSVHMGDITTSDFERVPETVPLGEAAAREAAPMLARYSVPAVQYAAWRSQVTSQQAMQVKLADVKYSGLERVNPEYLAKIAQVKPGDTVDIAKISAEAQRTSALQDFESVEYRLVGDPANPTLEWLPQEKRWGPDYLKFDIGVYGSAGGDLGFELYAKHTRTWINSLGAEWRNEFQVGYENALRTSFYQPLDIGQRFFAEPRATLSLTREDLFFDGERVATYNFGDIGGSVDLGVNFNRRSQARIGYLYTHRTVDVDTGSPFLPEGDFDDAGITFVTTYDSRDTAFNPTKGMAAMLEYMRSDESLGADREWDRIEAGVGMAVPVRKDVVWATFAGGSDLGSDLPPDRLFMLGGPGSFPGYELGELRAEAYWSAAGSYLWKLTDIMSLRGQALYAGMRLQVAQTYDRLDFVDDNGEVYGGSVYVTGRTQAGPLTIGVGATSKDAWSLWLSVGRPIGHGTILERGVFR
ncbi:MAG TPA: patatin-like phospholipase family protein [Steroidobacteraceae bacterium]|nr:patatin-like phospholipase family protein [Steroidobacteraceae bacterium]